MWNVEKRKKIFAFKKTITNKFPTQQIIVFLKYSDLW